MYMFEFTVALFNNVNHFLIVSDHNLFVCFITYYANSFSLAFELGYFYNP